LDRAAVPATSAPVAQEVTEWPEPNAERRPSDCRLVAYVAADGAQASFADLLRAYLSTRLPDYMVPSQYLVTERLPLKPDGKIDYEALPAETSVGGPDAAVIVGPANEFEARLSKIFGELLGCPQVGVDEDFFRLGGHSLLAAQLAARIREKFDVEVELRTLLEAPSVRKLAKLIELELKAAGKIAGTADREEILL
jgi:acyl carrier protein